MDDLIVALWTEYGWAGLILIALAYAGWKRLNTESVDSEVQLTEAQAWLQVATALGKTAGVQDRIVLTLDKISGELQELQKIRIQDRLDISGALQGFAGTVVSQLRQTQDDKFDEILLLLGEIQKGQENFPSPHS